MTCIYYERTLEHPALPAAGVGSRLRPGIFLYITGYLDDFLNFKKHDLSVCFSVHIIKVKPAENDGFYGMDAYGCKETWATVDTTIGAIDVMCVVCFINIIKQKHIICRRKLLRFFKGKFLKGCSLKTPYMYASIYQTNRENDAHVPLISSNLEVLFYHVYIYIKSCQILIATRSRQTYA